MWSHILQTLYRDMDSGEGKEGESVLSQLSKSRCDQERSRGGHGACTDCDPSQVCKKQEIIHLVLIFFMMLKNLMFYKWK